MNKTITILFTLLVIFTLNTNNLHAEASKDMKIAVIGAGASGLTAAYYLEKMGYTNVVVYEKYDRGGGKVYSYNHNGDVFELGAFWAGAGYDTVEEMIAATGVEFVAEDANLLVRTEDDQIIPIFDLLWEKYSLWEISYTFAKYNWVKWKFPTIQGTGFEGAHPDLFMNFDAFAKNIESSPLPRFFVRSWIGCGYGYDDETPAIYVLKMMVGSLDATIKGMMPFADKGQTDCGERRRDIKSWGSPWPTF